MSIGPAERPCGSLIAGISTSTGIGAGIGIGAGGGGRCEECGGALIRNSDGTLACRECGLVAEWEPELAPSRSSWASAYPMEPERDPEVERAVRRLCAALGLPECAAAEASRLARSRKARGTKSLHAAAAVFHVCRTTSGALARTKEEWRAAVREAGLKRPGRPAAEGRRDVSLWRIAEYAGEVYGSGSKGGRTEGEGRCQSGYGCTHAGRGNGNGGAAGRSAYWHRLGAVLTTGARTVLRAERILRLPSSTAAAAGALLLADYRREVTREDLVRAGTEWGAAMRKAEELRSRIGGALDAAIAVFTMSDDLGLPWEVEEEALSRLFGEAGGRSAGRNGARYGARHGAAVLYAAAMKNGAYRLREEWDAALEKALSSSSSPEGRARA
ncbi:MAG: hypothetical protein QXG08_06265 [Candidatus Methanomethyliaceae archaeon]